MKINLQTRPLLIALGLICLLLGFFLLIEPSLNKIKAIQRAEEDLKSKALLITDIGVLEKQYEGLKEWLAESREKNTLVGKTTSLANANGLEVVSLEPAEQEAKPFNRFVMNLKAQGPFPGVGRFIQQLETLKPLVSVKQLRIGQMSQRQRFAAAQQQGVISSEMVVEAYVKK